MPRMIRGMTPEAKPLDPELLSRLVAELKSGGQTGQPLIDEVHLPESGAIRAMVIWDLWSGVKDDDRTRVILEAYDQVEGSEYRAKIANAVGLTVSEAIDAGVLPFQVVPNVRKHDSVSSANCYQAMIEEGGSLGRDIKPRLRFITLEDAQACRERLIHRLPRSDTVWMVSRVVGELAD